MGKPYQLPLQGFKGLDLRLTAEGTEPQYLRVANNVDLGTGGSIKARDQIRPFATVDSTSLGLYVVAGRLRCAVPLSGGTIPVAPPGILYDYFANSTTGQQNGSLELAGAQNWNGNSYLCVKRYVDQASPQYGFEWEHHYCIPKLAADLPGTVTKVDLPFTPGPQLYSFARKIWSHDANTNDVWYSSSINGPTDWTNSGDAGYLSVSQQTAGDKILRGFSRYGDKLMLFFSDSVQFWNVFTDPADNELSEAINGVGSINTRSIIDMGGSTVYFSNGGFRTVGAVAVTGEKNDSDIGANIYPETRNVNVSVNTPISVWSPTRSQMLTAIGSIMYVYTNSPQSGVTGWTKYTLPFVVTDMVENNGVVYMRSGNTIYQFDSTYTLEANFSWIARLAYQHGQTWGVPKSWFCLQAAMQGTTGLRFYVDPRDETKINVGPRVSGSRYGMNKIPLAMVAPSVAPEFYGNTAWTLDALVMMVRDGQL
jgi:hypothetical protein